MNTRDVNMGRLIAEWRKGIGLSQASLAEALGTQQATVSKLETGVYKLTVTQLLDILDACGLVLSDVTDSIEKAAGSEGKPLWERIDE